MNADKNRVLSVGERARPQTRMEQAGRFEHCVSMPPESETLDAMQEINRRDLLRLGAGLGLAVAPRVLSAAGRMRFSKYEVLPTSVPMAQRVREAWTESYRLQGTFQTHYSPVFVRLHTDEGL